MKITLITTLADLEENKRLEEEIKSRGFEFEMVDLSNFGYMVDETDLDIMGLTNLKADYVIVRGIFNTINTICAVTKNLRKKGIKVFDNNFTEVKYSIDKVADLVKLSFAKIEIPKTCYTKDFAKYPEMAAKIGYPVIVKSTRTGKGASVYKADSEEDLKGLISDLESQEKEAKSYLLQEYIPYKYDLRILIIGESVFAMRRIPAEGEFRANFSLGGSVELYDLDEDGKELARKALEACEMSIGGVDMLIKEDGKRYIIEVNHTAGWLGMEKATGENITKIWVDHAISQAK